MNDIDAAVGYWIQDSPYLFVEGKGVEDSDREYGQLPKNLNTVLKGCDGSNTWASNYFHTTRPDISDHINGRNYHQELKKSYPTRPFKILRPQPIDCSLRKTYGKFEGRWFDISYLICSSMRGSPSIEATLIALENCPPITKEKDCSACTTVGHRVATSLIKIAAQRIFADPEQSIIELPVNSLDAYSPSSRIGKFGLGFFSILYWLIDHPKRKLVITSFYKVPSRDVYCTFRSTIQEVNGVLAFFLEFPESNITMTGVHMYLDTTSDPLPSTVVTNMVTQLEKLHYTVSARIVGKYSTPPATNIKRLFINEAPDDSKNMVYISIDTKGLTSEDYATGIPFEVYVTVLLQPSISTKTITGGATLNAPFKNKSRIEPSEGTLPKLIILVGNVAVVSIEGAPTTSADAVFNHIVDLPVTTRLPVSRDDVILDEVTAPIFVEGLASVLRDTKRVSSLAILQELLLAYQSYTASDTTRQLISKVVDDYIQEVRPYLVPQEFRDVYAALSPNFIPSITYFPDSLSETVSQTLLGKNNDTITVLDDIYYGKRVIILPNIRYDISNAGLSDYIFLNQKYFDSLTKKIDANGKLAWISTVAVAYQNNEALYPMNTNYGDEANAFNELIIKENAATISLQRGVNPVSDPKVKAKLLAVLNKIDALEVYFNVDSAVKADLAYDSLQYVLNFRKDGFNTLTDAMFQRFSRFKGSQTYGAAQNKLTINPTQILATKNMETYFNERWKHLSLEQRLPRTLYVDYEKLRRYAVKWQSIAIRNIEETSSTVITTIGEYNPLNVMVDAFSSRPVGAMDTCGKCAMFLANLLEQSRDYIEFSKVVLAFSIKLEILLKPVQISDIEKLVAHILQYVRINKYATNELDLINSWSGFLDVAMVGVQLALIFNDAKLWVDYNSLAQPLEIGAPNKDIEGGFVFTTNAMIQYAFTHELPTSSKELNTTFREIEKFVPPQRNPLQIIEIAVNEGTTKPFIDAVMTELTQNSIDAIRETRFVVDRIELNLKTTEARDKLIFTITDYVGLTPTAFLYIGFPFLSTKSPSELVTGEMGSGFFNVYRETEEVNISSQTGLEMYESHDVPIRDFSGRVIDIRRKMKHRRVAGNEKRMTTIELVIPVLNENDLISKASRFAYMADRVLGLALTKNIYYNGRKVSIERQLISKNKHFELYINPDEYNAYGSYLLTKGVPFQSLDGYIRNSAFLTHNAVELLTTDVTINIVHGAYTPVQTRTRINLAPDVEKSFKAILFDAVFARSVIAVYQGKKSDSIFPNYQSYTQAAQIKFTENDSIPYFNAPGIFLYHHYNGQPQVAATVNTLTDHIGELEGSGNQARKIIDEELFKVYPGEEPINKRLRFVIRSWFTSKNPPIVTQAPVFEKKIIKRALAKKGKAKKKVTFPPEYDKLESYFQAMAQVYWDIGKKFGVKGMTGDAPKVVFYDFSEENVAISGAYFAKEHVIKLNVARFPRKEVEIINSAIASKNQDNLLALSNKSTAWKKEFSYRFPSSTFYHELEHARRHTAHDAGGSHDSINEALFPGDKVTLRTFDEATNAILDQILKNEYYEKVFHEIPGPGIDVKMYRNIVDIHKDLINAINAGNTAALEELIAEGADINEHGEEALFTAINVSTDKALFDILIVAGANVNYEKKKKWRSGVDAKTDPVTESMIKKNMAAFDSITRDLSFDAKPRHLEAAVAEKWKYAAERLIELGLKPSTRVQADLKKLLS